MQIANVDCLWLQTLFNFGLQKIINSFLSSKVASVGADVTNLTVVGNVGNATKFASIIM